MEGPENVATAASFQRRNSPRSGSILHILLKPHGSPGSRSSTRVKLLRDHTQPIYFLAKEGLAGLNEPQAFSLSIPAAKTFGRILTLRTHSMIPSTP
jgi:hypothetical protein